MKEACVATLYPPFIIDAPYKCTCFTHQTTQLSLPSFQAYALCANALFQLKRRLWDRGMAEGLLQEQIGALHMQASPGGG